MTTEQTPAEGIGAVTEDPVTNADLNRYAKEQKARADAKTVELISIRFEQLGLDPTEGPGKAYLKTYDGESSKDAVQAYLKEEYGYEPPEGEAVSNTPTEAEAAQAKADDVLSTSESITPPGQENPLVGVEQRMNSAEGSPTDANQSIFLKVDEYVKNLP